MEQNQAVLRTRRSRAFHRAEGKAAEYARNPERLTQLIDSARRKSERSRGGRLAEVWGGLMDVLRLLRAYAGGRYRKIPWKSLLLIIASVSYFVMPLDWIPDFIAGVGFFDDAALLAWALNAVRADLAEFRTWECEHETQSSAGSLRSVES